MHHATIKQYFKQKNTTTMAQICWQIPLYQIKSSHHHMLTSSLLLIHSPANLITLASAHMTTSQREMWHDVLSAHVLLRERDIIWMFHSSLLLVTILEHVNSYFLHPDNGSFKSSSVLPSKAIFAIAHAMSRDTMIPIKRIGKTNIVIKATCTKVRKWIGSTNGNL